MGRPSAEVSTNRAGIPDEFAQRRGHRYEPDPRSHAPPDEVTLPLVRLAPPTPVSSNRAGGHELTALLHSPRPTDTAVVQAAHQNEHP
jgi:hypothetical protein